MKWDEHEIIECLGVLPRDDENGEFKFFPYSTGDISLDLCIFNFVTGCSITLRKTESYAVMLEMTFLVRNEIEYFSDPRYSSLRFRDCVFIEDRYWDLEGLRKKGYFDHSKFPAATDIELTTLPLFGIRILEAN